MPPSACVPEHPIWHFHPPNTTLRGPVARSGAPPKPPMPPSARLPKHPIRHFLSTQYSAS
eukprot:5253297-Pyramimonas_sp.AAC.1